MRESLTEKAQTPTATTTEAEGERAQSQMTGDPKKVSSGPFRSSLENRKTENKPGMPGLSPVQGRMCGGQNPIAPAVQGSSAHTVRVQRKRNRPMSTEDREQFDGLISQIRDYTVKGLDHLIRYDEAISLEGADTLAAALVSIQKADSPNLPGIPLTRDIRLEAINLLTAIFEHDGDLNPFERADVERVINILDSAIARRQGS